MPRRPTAPVHHHLAWRVGLALLLAATLAPASRAEALDLLQDNTDGTVGVYLKQVGGPVRDAFNETTIFEGASTNKTMIHVHAMLQIQNGSATLSEMIPVATDLSGSCPQGTGIVMESLEDALRLMMQASDNARTQAVRDRFGDVNINATVQALGMTDSLLNAMQTLGCGADALQFPNQLTAVDLGTLYEQVLTGFLDPATRQEMFDLMLNETNSFYVNALINEEALAAGLTAAETLQFKSQIHMAHKGGSYTLVPSQGPTQEYRSLAGYIELPYACEGESRQFTYTAFVDNATSLDTQGTGTDLDIFRVAGELLRLLIPEALESALCARAPEVSAPLPLTLECNTQGGVAIDDPQIAAWLGGGSASDECDAVGVETDAPKFFPAGCAPGAFTPVTFSATDSCGSTGSELSGISVQDTLAPALVVPADQTIECTSPDGAFASVVATGADVCDGVSFLNSRTGATNDASGTYPLGDTTVAWDAADSCDNHACGWTTVAVVDTTAPVVDCSAAGTLWPPNHQMEEIGLGIDVVDACDPSPAITISVTSDEDPATESGAGGANHCPDAIVCGESVQLRAERSGAGDGRVYMVHVVATDASGNSGSCDVAVSVPMSRGKHGTAVDSGQVFDPTTCDAGGPGNGNGNGNGNGQGPGNSKRR